MNRTIAAALACACWGVAFVVIWPEYARCAPMVVIGVFWTLIALGSR